MKSDEFGIFYFGVMITLFQAGGIASNMKDYRYTFWNLQLKRYQIMNPKSIDLLMLFWPSMGLIGFYEKCS